MKLISYAQNFEDVLLWRALGHVADGFYIDVGANDPVDHSVTKAFYDSGWHGINIEPLPGFHHAFLAQRPRDINLAIAAGAEDGRLTLYDVPAVNGWATPDRAVAQAHRAEGFQVSEITVPVRTLASICAEHVQGEIHFLKIDVEGFEGEVLRGMDFARWRPWIVVVEATMPNSRVTNHETWEPLIATHGYRFAWFDGLNRYYVAQEHPQLLEALSIQPNVFDNFISHHLKQAWADHTASSRAAEDALRRLDLANSEIDLVNAKCDELNFALAEAHANAEKVALWARDLEQSVNDLRQSTSWRVTRPLRQLGELKQMARRGLLLRHLARKVTGNERMRSLIIPVLLRFPWLARRVSVTLAAIKHATPTGSGPESALPDHIRALPVSARTVLADLRRARRRTTPDA